MYVISKVKYSVPVEKFGLRIGGTCISTISGASSLVYRTLFMTVMFDTVMQPEVCTNTNAGSVTGSVEFVFLDLWWSKAMSATFAMTKSSWISVLILFLASFDFKFASASFSMVPYFGAVLISRPLSNAVGLTSCYAAFDEARFANYAALMT